MQVHYWVGPRGGTWLCFSIDLPLAHSLLAQISTFNRLVLLSYQLHRGSVSIYLSVYALLNHFKLKCSQNCCFHWKQEALKSHENKRLSNSPTRYCIKRGLSMPPNECAWTCSFLPFIDWHPEYLYNCTCWLVVADGQLLGCTLGWLVKLLLPWIPGFPHTEITSTSTYY